MAKEKLEKDVKDKKDKKDGKDKDKKDGKDKDKKKGVTFVHERLTELPPPRYPVGQEPPLPPWPITWTPIGICLESSVPGLSIDILIENFNKLARPSMSMVVVHPKDLAEDEMAIDGTILAELLKKEKEESSASWPSSNLLDKCLKSRSVLDRDNEHRNEEVRRATTVVEAKQASEDFKAKLALAKEEVTVAETNLKAYRTKLLEEVRARKAERKLAKAANKVDAPEIGETELSKVAPKQNELKDKKLEGKEKKEGKVGKKQDRDKQGEKGEKGPKGKAGKDEPEPVLVPIVSPQVQFKLYEEEVTNKKVVVKELEAKLLSSVENEATLLSTLLEPFTAGRLYCILGMDSALPAVQLACEEKSFFKAIFNIAPKPKDSSLLPVSEEPGKAQDDDVSSVTSSKAEKRASRKEAKLAKKEAKAAMVATATPPLVGEIRAIFETGSIMEPARSVSVVDVWYETPLPPESNGADGESTKQEKMEKKQKDDGGGKKGKEDKQDKMEKKQKDDGGGKKGKEDKQDKIAKKVKGGKEEQQEVGDKGDEEKLEKKNKKSKTAKNAAGAKDESLPYEQIGQAVVLAVQGLLLQVQLYGAMGGDKVKIYKVPVAKPLQGKDCSYYNQLLNEFPQGLVSVSVIVHCLLEQVATYDWPTEDIKAIEVSNLNKKIRNGIYHEFEKLGHPKWLGVEGDLGEKLPTRFEGFCNILHMEEKTISPSIVTTNNDVIPGAKVQEQMADGALLNLRGDDLNTSRNGCCDLHWKTMDTCEPTLRKGRPIKLYNPFIQAQELEDKLHVTHEFDTITQRSLILKPVDLEFTESINATRVGQHLSMLRATPARSRYKMPGIPEYSEEKMGASLTALQDLCDHYDKDQPKFQSLEDALFHCKDLGLSNPVDINTMQRYKKLTTFLEMIKEDKDVFPDLDIPMKEISESGSDNVIRGPYDLDEMKYWCSNCLAFFKRPEIMEEKPKEPLTDEELIQLKKMFQTKLVDDYEKRQLDKGQSPNCNGEESQSNQEDAFSQEMIEAGIFSEKNIEGQANDDASTGRELDPKVVKMWCAGCQSVFLPPPPPTLEEIWAEGKRMREEMERLAARDAQAVVDAKIEAWKRLEQRIRNSILGRRHAEGFSDGLMGEMYAQAKLHLPFENLRYDHDEDCILSCLYAANTQRNIQEQIPCLMQFGDFCATYDLASGDPIKKQFAVYEMEPQYKLVLDERRYVLAEQDGLVICGLPAKSPVQYEPRATIYKDGNVIMLRSIKAAQKSESIREEAKTETDSFESGKEGHQGKKARMGDDSPDTQQAPLKKRREEEGNNIPALTGKKGGKKTKKEAKRKDKAKTGQEATDLLDHTSGVVHEQANANHASVPLDLLNGNQGHTGLDPLSPGLLESERSVIACLKDGLIATFFFAQDATLHLQINIPAGGRTFEITSNGVVIFLPFEIQKQEQEPALGISTSNSPEAEPTEISKNGTNKMPNKEVSPPKELSGDKSKQKKRQDAAGKDGEPRAKSKKKNEKPVLDKPEREEKAEMDGNIDPGKGGDEGQLVNDLELINGLCKKGVGDMEVSRCILPSGTVVSYKENGFSQILFNNGNISEYKIISEKTLGWVTTNNKGFSVLQDPPTAEPAMDDEVTTPDDTKVSKSGKGKNKGAEKEKSKVAKQQEQDADSEKEPKTKAAKAAKDTKQNDAKKDKKVVSFAEQDGLGVTMASLGASDPNLPPVEAERPHVQLPSKKVVEVFDPDTGSSIITREDLVVMMNTNDNTVRVVQHADGTHIYSEVKETIEEYNPSAGQISLDRTKEFSSSTKLKPENPSADTMAGSPLPIITSEIDSLPNSTIKTGGVLVIADNESNSAPELGQQTDSGLPLARVLHAKKKLYSTQWHVRKESFPSVHGNTSGGVAVEFTTTDGQYCVTWSRQSGNISVLMPNGSMIYSSGKLINFDPSDGTKRSDPKQLLQNQPIDGPSFINTNGIYEFNLERANLTFTDNSGNGFRSNWGYKVELITNGLLQRPPKPEEKTNLLSDVSELLPNAQNPISTDGKINSSQKGAAATINSDVPAAIGKNKESSAKATGRSKTLQVQPTRSSQVRPPLSPISESHTFDSGLSLTTTDPGFVSESGTVDQQSSVSDNEEADDADESMLGPTARLFVIHEGGFGFEIIHENDFNNYTSSKKWSKDCTHVREVYEEVSAILHTFVTVEQKAKKLAEVFLQAQEGCRAPDGLKLWTRKVSEFARRIKLKAIQTKMHKRTRCDWLQINLNLPYLPRVVAPELLPVLPLSNVTKVVFRQIFEYPSFHDEQIPRMGKILESYNTWQENAMILTDVEQHPDTRTKAEIEQAQAIAESIREVRAEKKLQEARDRAAVEVQHATEVFREMMKAETERLRKFEESKSELRKEGERDWLQYKESKKGPLLCVHKPSDNLQTKGPYRPDTHVRLCYFECEEGLQYIISLQYQQWHQYPEDPRRWSVEALPPISYSYQGSAASQSSGENDATSGYGVPCMTPRLKEEIVPTEPPCLLSEWMRELEMKAADGDEDNEGKMCWEFMKPKRKILGPADWTPCFLEGFDEKCEDTDARFVIEIAETKEAHQGPVVEKVIEEPYVEAEEIKAKIPLPDLQTLWSIPTGEEWEINHEAVQRQSELIPNFPGWRKAGWRKNKKYLDVNLGTLLCANISSIGTLRNRPWPPKDWSRQFLVVPDFLNFGTVAYGTISMKVLFLQNYHGTEPGRFRFENLGPSIKLLCELGMVPPGLSRAVRIFFRASALGDFNHEIRILTQYDVFEVPIFGNVVLPQGYY